MAAPCNLPAPAPSPELARPQYGLYKGLGFWVLTFQGQTAPLKHEQGLYYVAYLLLNPPPEPIHGLALSLKVAALYGRPIATPEIIDPATGTSIPLALDSGIQQRSLGIEEADAAFALRRKQLELEAILDDEAQIDPVKAEAIRELEAIYAYQKYNPARPTDAAQKAVRAVRIAILRLHEHLALALDAAGRPHPVLRPFAAHLEQYLLAPSRRYSRPGRAASSSGLAGTFTYEPPPGVTWRASAPSSPAPEASPLAASLSASPEHPPTHVTHAHSCSLTTPPSSPATEHPSLS